MPELPNGSPDTPFDRAYLEGVPDAVEAPKAVDAVPELAPRFAPSEPIALHGCLLTPDEAIDRGYLLIEEGVIAEIRTTKPAATTIIETDGVVTPGLIDLHGHPEFNVFAAWEPPKLYLNRYAWRNGSEEYQLLVREPANRLKAAKLTEEQLRYAEIRALVGGVTAIQGAGQSADTTEALVRNVDKSIFGKQVGRAAIDLPGEPTATDPDGFGLESFNRILDAIKSGEASAFYVHLAEGQASNELSRNELDKLVRLNGLTPATVIIHGTALTEDQLGDVRDARAKLVWSPQSNLRLYGETTLADKALAMKLPLALGADWLPSGSTSLLAEMKVARHWLASRGTDIGAQALVQMVTMTAATIAGLADRLGHLDEKRPADLAVFERSHEDPWESVAQATPAEVNLVMIGGDVAYIRGDWLEDLNTEDHQDHLEPLWAWGRRMVLDTSFVAGREETQPRLAEIRASLIAAYPNIGPVFA
jgi:cytosine/adenosine deaminase-related metal-dependent hydrolase